MTRSWLISINGAAPVHVDLAQYADAVERAEREGKRVVIVDVGSRKQPALRE